jgi:mono/diheme cytochrome c family protein
MRGFVAFLVVIAAAMAGTASLMACTGASSNGSSAGTPASTAAPIAATTKAPSASSAVANGAMIFQTGRDVDGVRIAAASPPMEPNCAACHHADGSGGRKFGDGAVSADLRYAALVTHQKPPYDLLLLERAISTGVDNTGQPLDKVMPRWRLSKRDLHDVAVYVLTKLK